ncbi:uncharacterized protein IL334_004938 [Kwoniella shivajii]|uniref:CAP-Gly domain-containing protein n=1 Tax=Kwoniella shivajii TaxID=564305 RepID=A0ABZ1D357_9TREE|nr:hypothetical protein IL334_004938 [Kwoniella shivajii]
MFSTQIEAGPSTPTARSRYTVGQRYLHCKTLHPLTLRYIGPLPPSPPSSFSSSASFSDHAGNDTIWLGVEYDSPSHGKGHNGTYKDIKVFDTRENGSGSFVKLVGEPLKEGRGLIESIQERYGRIIIPSNQNETPNTQNQHTNSSVYVQNVEKESIILGSTKIIVETPNLSNVQERIGRLEKLRNIGFEEEFIGSLGGDDNDDGTLRKVLKERMKGLKWLNISRNLISSWEEIRDIVYHFEGLEILTLNHSRFEPLSSTHEPDQLPKFKSTFNNIQELHLSDCCLSWDEICFITLLFPNIRILHLEANRLLTNLNRRLEGLRELKELRLGGCPISNWNEIVSSLSDLPQLENLDISFTSIRSINSSSSSDTKQFSNLKSIIMVEAQIRHWNDLDNLSDQLPNLTSIRITIPTSPMPIESLSFPSVKSDSVGKGLSITKKEEEEGQNEIQLVDEKTLRLICISKFGRLTSFNSGTISSTERRDAELFYISFVRKWVKRNGGDKEERGRYQELCGIHGVGTESIDDGSVRKGKGGLRSKMINLKIHTSLMESDDNIKEISLLPSSPLSLLQRKASRLLGLPQVQSSALQVWSLNLVEGQEVDGIAISAGEQKKWEKVIKVTNPWEDKQIGWWFENDDDIYVEHVVEED